MDESILFDGQTLDGWTMAGDGEFVIVHAALETRGGMGLLWHSARPFADFNLHVEWRTATASDNGGVFVRFPDPHSDPWVAVHHGYEIQILDDANTPEQRTGAIYSFAGPDDVLSVEPGRWNRLDIRVVHQHYTTIVNGRVATRFEGHRNTTGYIGLQNHDDNSRVQYRNVRILELVAV